MAKAPVELESIAEQEVLSFLSSFDTVLTDCDGVLWEGNAPIEGSPDVINLLRQAGKKVVYVTNNGTKSRKQYVKKCQDLGFGGEFTDIFTTSFFLTFSANIFYPWIFMSLSSVPLCRFASLMAEIVGLCCITILSTP